jgi:lipoate-protein ligase A
MRIEQKVPGGKMVGIDVEINDGKIEQIKITGDFFLHPEKTIALIEEALLGHSIDEVGELVSRVLSENEAQLIGVTPQDIEEMLRKVA